MLIDYLTETLPADIEADVCIIGAGPAGIAIARTFLGKAVRICMVESGGLAVEQISQQFCEGSSIGSPALDPGTSRTRVFGGTCKLWGGGCIPLGHDDLSTRDWVPHSGWPLTYSELEPYYAAARGVCGIESHAFGEGSFHTPPARPPIPFDASQLVNQIFMRSTVSFGKRYRAELEQAENIQVLLQANLIGLHASADGSSIREARIRSLGGKSGVIRARHYVLACGGIENARALLLSDSVTPHGLGNDRDLVGRFFMDHPSGKLATLFADAPHRVTQPYQRSLQGDQAESFPEICLSREAITAHRLLSGRVRPVAVEDTRPNGVRALRRFRAALRPAAQDASSALEEYLCAALRYAPNDQGVLEARESLGKLTWQLGLGMGDIAMAMARKLRGKPAIEVDHVDLMGYFEQAPNRDSRITLGDELDALGQRKVCVDWRLTELDRHTYRTAATIFSSELARACGGTFQLEPWLAEEGARPRRCAARRTTWARPGWPTIRTRALSTGNAGFTASTTCMSPAVRCFPPVAGPFRLSPSSR